MLGIEWIVYIIGLMAVGFLLSRAIRKMQRVNAATHAVQKLATFIGTHENIWLHPHVIADGAHVNELDVLELLRVLHPGGYYLVRISQEATVCMSPEDREQLKLLLEEVPDAQHYALFEYRFINLRGTHIKHISPKGFGGST